MYTEHLYLISLAAAMVFASPLVLLVLFRCRNASKNTRIIAADRFRDAAALEQRIREAWWESRFYGEAGAGKVIVFTGGSKEAKRLCRKLKAEFPALIVRTGGNRSRRH